MTTTDPTEPFGLATVERIAQRLSPLDLSSPLDREHCGQDLRRYFATYGFDQLHAYPYSLGYLSLEHYRVVLHYWSSPDAKATVLVSHGLFDHVGLYLDLVACLLQNNMNVVAIDYPGHGLSEGMRAVIHDFSEYSEVIAQVISHLENRIVEPFYAVGQSTGSAALMSYLLAGQGKKITRAVLLAPLIRPVSWALIKTIYVLFHKHLDGVPRNFKPNSHRADFNAFLKHGDPLQARQITVPWVGAMKKWIEGFPALPQSDIPVMIIQGDNDTTVDWQKNVPEIEEKFSHCQVEIIPGAMHHLVKEDDAWREPVFNKMQTFLSASTTTTD